MARFNASEASNYGGQGGGGFFKIDEDKGVKQVRFLYNKIEDVEGMSVHRVKIDGKDKYVNCIRNYNDPVDACPFCRENYPVTAKLFIPLYNITEDQVQLWDRGKKMFEKMTSLCARYASKQDLVQHIFEIERHGKPKSMDTTYEIFEVDSDDTRLEDLPEQPEILGRLVLDKTAEDMEYFLEAKQFPPEDGEEEEEPPVRRRDSREETETRRTPANREGRRRGEGY